jgi:Nif-specific regulatory protein
MPEADVDAQLFGWDSASPDDAIGGSVGRAQTGTLFVDDVAELGPLAQKRIVDLARDRVCERPDGVRVAVNVRVVAATTRDLARHAPEGGYRRDLSEYLGAMAIQMPPLRERKSDLALLTDLFVEHFAREHVRGVRGVSARAMDMLMNYDWPGNVSQLQLTIERAVVMTSGPVIHHHHLPSEIQTSGDAATVPMLGLNDALEAYEKELLQDALRQARGVRSQAARLLMTSERVFSYRLRKHRIDTRRFKAS